MKLKTLRREHGFALPLALASVLAFSIIATLFAEFLTHELQVNKDIEREWQAQYIAESGVENALYNVKQAVYNGGSPYTSTTPFQIEDHLPSGAGTGTLTNTDSETVGSYTWSVQSETDVSTVPEITTHRLVIHSTGTYVDPVSAKQSKFTVTQTFDIEFEPTLIPASPVSIIPVAYSQSPG